MSSATMSCPSRNLSHMTSLCFRELIEDRCQGGGTLLTQLFRSFSVSG